MFVRKASGVGPDEEQRAVVGGVGEAELDGQTGFADAPLAVDHAVGDEGGRPVGFSSERNAQLLHIVRAAEK
jgi:hypothetical protein